MGRMVGRLRIWIGLAGASLIAAGASGQTATARPSAPTPDQVEEIVVTARRSGVPVWRVTGPNGTIVLVGAIEEVSKATKWDPTNLTLALRKADRVMFPQTLDLNLSPFAMVGLAVRLIRISKLPEGQTLAGLLPRSEFERLVALQRKGVLKRGFERRHPLLLAIELQDYAEGKAGTGDGAEEYVRRAVKKYKIEQVPIAKANAKKPVKRVLKAAPQAHLPCLRASITLAEAGPGAVQARSDAWAQRRVPDVLSSPAEKAFQACELDDYLDSPPDWRGQLRRVLAEPRLTMVVLNLATLARSGGVLDQLAANGYDIQGPDWRSK